MQIKQSPVRTAYNFILIGRDVNQHRATNPFYSISRIFSVISLCGFFRATPAAKRASLLLLFRHQIIFVKLIAQCTDADSEGFGCFCAVVMASL